MATNGDEGPSFFARFIEEPKPVPPPDPLPTPPIARELLYWLQDTWTKPTIRWRDIYRHGPNPVRNNRESALSAAEILVRGGWLLPLKADRRDVKRWQVTIGPI